MKTCSKCKKTKSYAEFYKNRTQADGFEHYCKDCKKANNNEKGYSRRYMKKNRVRFQKRLKIAQRKYAQSEKGKEKQRIKSLQRYYKLKAYPEKRLPEVLRSRLRAAIKGKYKAGSAVRDLGCSIPELKTYLESKFQPGMTWENWSRDGWHIDHVKPLASFDLTDPQQLKQACHYSNLQPLWAVDNLSKCDKIG